MRLTKEQISEMVQNVQKLLMMNEYKAKNPDELVRMSVMYTLDEMNLEYDEDAFEIQGEHDE